MGELFTLAGVFVGAASSYVLTSLHERSRWTRQMATRWDEHRLAAYLSFIGELDEFIEALERMAAAKGTFPIARSIRVEEGLEILAQANAECNHAFESLLLMGDSSTISAARALRRSAWNLEHLVQPDYSGSVGEWRIAYREYQERRDDFYSAARGDLGVLGKFRRRGEDPPTWDLPE
ncbi:hypothetical protein QF037_009812 [Streptomyces canus]|uniref:hypothetical protein n=1 Tax=Streptomyces canus TaxID=58343 RepID=UPI002783E200|nr:hypothetical protein [Streptomyces canus]MDQ0605467.1 hypothetical protein [Streptomyces canus]